MATQSHDASSGGSTDAEPSGVGSTPRGGGNRAKQLAPAILGGALLAAGLKRRSLRGVAAALAGVWLLYRGLGRVRQPGESDGSGRSDESESPAGATAVERTVTIGKPADELYEAWRDPENHSRVMSHFAEVDSTGEDRQHWTINGPLGRSIEWEAEVVEQRPGEFLRWESLEGAELPNEGSVHFRPAPDGRGTEVTLRFRFDPPGGAIGYAALERLDIVPGTLAEKSLDRFKSLVEAGEIPTLEKNPSARGSGDLV